MAKYFLDANIILDLIDSDRGNLITTREFVKEVILKGSELCTSCDIFTTVYYVGVPGENGIYSTLRNYVAGIHL